MLSKDFWLFGGREGSCAAIEVVKVGDVAPTVPRFFDHE
jgi:hypothetical protein